VRFQVQPEALLAIRALLLLVRLDGLGARGEEVDGKVALEVDGVDDRGVLGEEEADDAGGGGAIGVTEGEVKGGAAAVVGGGDGLDVLVGEDAEGLFSSAIRAGIVERLCWGESVVGIELKDKSCNRLHNRCRVLNQNSGVSNERVVAGHTNTKRDKFLHLA